MCLPLLNFAQPHARRMLKRASPVSRVLNWSTHSATRLSVMAISTVQSLRQSLCSENTPLPIRFRALFSLKHLARMSAGQDAIAAIDVIAAGFASPSALLKHELAYCLGQTGHEAAVNPLRSVLSNLDEDPMCRHEAAEALGALGRADDLDLLKNFRDREGEDVVVKETCEIAIDRINWENSEERSHEKLRHRLGVLTLAFHVYACSRDLAILHQLIPHRQCLNQKKPLTTSRSSSSMSTCLFSCDTAPCLRFATLRRLLIRQRRSLQCSHWQRASKTSPLCSGMRLPLFSGNYHIQLPFQLSPRH